MAARSASVSIPGVEACLVARKSPEGGVCIPCPVTGRTIGLLFVTTLLNGELSRTWEWPDTGPILVGGGPWGWDRGGS